jgi:hypothetical protein
VDLLCAVETTLCLLFLDSTLEHPAQLKSRQASKLTRIRKFVLVHLQESMLSSGTLKPNAGLGMMNRRGARRGITLGWLLPPSNPVSARDFKATYLAVRHLTSFPHNGT